MCCISNTVIMSSWKGEINKTIPFAIAPKRIKYLGVNLAKEVEDLCKEKAQGINERH